MFLVISALKYEESFFQFCQLNASACRGLNAQKVWVNWMKFKMGISEGSSAKTVRATPKANLQQWMGDAHRAPSNAESSSLCALYFQLCGHFEGVTSLSLSSHCLLDINLMMVGKSTKHINEWHSPTLVILWLIVFVILILFVILTVFVILLVSVILCLVIFLTFTHWPNDQHPVNWHL